MSELNMKHTLVIYHRLYDSNNEGFYIFANKETKLNITIPNSIENPFECIMSANESY
jgi:hypothetical protein